MTDEYKKAVGDACWQLSGVLGQAYASSLISPESLAGLVEKTHEYVRKLEEDKRALIDVDGGTPDERLANSRALVKEKIATIVRLRAERIEANQEILRLERERIHADVREALEQEFGHLCNPEDLM